jgi:hypothetical protein
MPGGRKTEATRAKAVAALLACGTIKTAARKCGVSYRALREWIKSDPEFQAAYAEAAGQAMHHGLRRVQALTAVAATVLGKVLRGKPGDAKTALGLIDRALAASQVLDLASRVAALERAAKARKRGGR